MIDDLENPFAGAPETAPEPPSRVALEGPSLKDPVGFDIETPSKDKLLTFRSSADHPYARLNGLVGADGEEIITNSPEELIARLEAADSLYGHNILRYDLIGIAWHHGTPELYDRLAKKAWDSYVDETVTDPPGGQFLAPWNEKGYYSLDRALERRGEPGKTDHLPEIAKEYGKAAGLIGKAAETEGYELIDRSDPRYRAYLSGDLKATRNLYRRQQSEHPERMDYRRREMRVAWMQNRMTLTGWKIDVPLLRERVREEAEKRQESLQWLAEHCGVPLTETRTRGRGSKKETYEVERKSPLASDAGKEALIRALRERGLPYYLETDTGKLALNKDALGEGAYIKGKGKEKVSLPGLLNPERQRLTPGADWAAIAEMAEHVTLVTTSVQKYQEIANHLIGDRVHAHVGETQGSRRWAMVQPSVTNLGKRGGKVVQRAPFIADDGCVLIAFDLDQVDMRAFAGHCGDEAYVGMFHRGEDPHSMIANMVFDLLEHGCDCPDKTRHTCHWRERAKASGHGWNYGLSVNGLVLQGIPREVAEKFDAGMNTGYPDLCRWRSEVRDLGEAGHLLDNGFGALMRVDPKRSYTQAPALMGQGTARDILVHGMLRLPEEYVPWMRGVVHDEVVFSVPEQRVEECIQVVTEAFTFDLAEATQGRLHSVPIRTGASKPALHWDSCYAKD